MKDMATYTRVNPEERMKRLTNFANRLLSKPEVNKLFFIVFEKFILINSSVFFII